MIEHSIPLLFLLLSVLLCLNRPLSFLFSPCGLQVSENRSALIMETEPVFASLSNLLKDYTNLKV